MAWGVRFLGVTALEVECAGRPATAHPPTARGKVIETEGDVEQSIGDLLERRRVELSAAENAQRKPFGWITTSSLYEGLRSDPPEGLHPKLMYLFKYRLFFCESLPEGTLEIIYDRPIESP